MEIQETFTHGKNIRIVSLVKVKLATLVEDDPNAPFLSATTSQSRVGATLFPGMLNFTLDTYLIMLNVKQRGIKYYSLSLWYDSGMNPGFPGHWRTLPHYKYN